MVARVAVALLAVARGFLVAAVAMVSLVVSRVLLGSCFGFPGGCFCHVVRQSLWYPWWFLECC